MLISAILRFKFLALLAKNLCANEDLSDQRCWCHRLYDLGKSSCFYLIIAIIEHKFLFVNINS